MNNLDLFDLQLLPYFKLIDIVFRELKRPKVNFYNIELLFDILKVDINIKENDIHNTPLHYSSVYNNNELTSYLLELGAQINNQNKYGMTPLHMACDLNCDETIKNLLEHEADVNILNKDLENPLMLYVKSGKKISIINLLIKSGTDLNQKDEYGKSILERIITFNNKNAFSILVNYIDINTILSFGVTPLMQSVMTTKYDIVSYLLDNGADTSIKINGSTAWDLADNETKREFPNLNPKN